MSPCIEETLDQVDPFREPVQIPGCSPSAFVYPYSSAAIDPGFHDRFREVINIFRRNTLEDPGLRENARFIDYTLRLCGTSPLEAHPSILVFCRNKDFKNLRALLTSKELKFQYALRKPPRKFPWIKTDITPQENNHRPSFNLYFWRERIPRVLFWGQQSDVIIQPGPTTTTSSEFTLCGSILVHPNNGLFSTLGLVIRIGLDWYAVTSKHAFYSSRSGTGPEVSWADFTPLLAVIMAQQEISAGSGTDRANDEISDDEDEYFVDDVTYDDSGDEDQEADSEYSQRREGNQLLPQDQFGEGNDNSVKHTYMFPTALEQHELNELDYDWAIVKLDDPNHWRPNAFTLNVGSPALAVQFFSGVAESFPSQPTAVFIITSAPSAVEGVLQPGVTFLGGINENRPSEVYTIMLNRGFGKLFLSRRSVSRSTHSLDP